MTKHREIPMGWTESVQDVLNAYPHFSKEDIHNIEVTPDGPVLVIRLTE